MMQEIQSVQNRYERRMEDSENSGTYDWIRSTRSSTWCIHSTRAIFPEFPRPRTQKRRSLESSYKLEEFSMKSVKESFQENSETERQAVISAQELAAVFRSEISQETTACDPRKSEVIRLTEELAEPSTKMIAGGNSLHYFSVPLPPPDW